MSNVYRRWLLCVAWTLVPAISLAVEPPRVEIIAYRGASADVPENTIAALKLGFEQQADTGELDVWVSRDGQAVVIHDGDTKRVSGVEKKVAEQTWAELQQLDVGRWKGADFAGMRIPTLEEALTTLPAGKRMFVEIKCGPDGLPAILRAIEKAGLKPENTPIISFSAVVLAKVKQQLPALPTYWIVSLKEQKDKPPTPLADLIEKAREIKADGLNVSASPRIDAEFVSQVRKAGLRLYVWTVDDAETARRLQGLGVDGITTNRPGWLRQQLQPKPDEPPIKTEELQAAVAKALPLLTKRAAGHREQRSCFACHQQALPILAMTAAQQRGVSIDEDELKKQLQYIADFLGKNRAGYLEGKGQGGQADMAGYALLALELGGWKPDETTAAVTTYLLVRNAEFDHWRANSQRPPTEASHFTTSYVALRGLAAFGTAEQQGAILKRREQVREWLVKTPAGDHEDRVFRLFGLKLTEAATSDVEAAAKELAGKQQADGGWAELDVGEPSAATQSDAYATGTALVVLSQAGGLNTSTSVYQRGLRYLLKTQQADGTWHVVSRSRPFQKYFESGFPHGKDQFISSAATGWAATALALALEPLPRKPAEPASPATADRTRS